MELKYKNTTIKVIKADISRLETDTVIAPFDKVSAKASSFEYDKFREVCFSALNIANEKRFKVVAFLLPAKEVLGTLKVAAAKIMAQEVFKHIRDKKSELREILFVLNDADTFNCFQENVFSYLDYITHKVSNGPFATVDIIIEMEGKIVLIERSNPPFGWALPGGFVDYGESLEQTATREAKEETHLDIYDYSQFHIYSEPGRDPRFHTITTVFTARARGNLKADSDAKAIGVFSFEQIKAMRLAFDHNKIIEDYFKSK